MLVASCLFKEDGTLLESKIPNIVVGDKESVKLEVSFYEDYDNLKLLNLSNYVVEAIFERPDGKVSPALLLGIDLNNFNKKYLIFGGWLTEVAGISKITVRIKKSGTVKATGFLTFTIHDGNVPADVAITEPQFEALQNAINAEEQARIADFQKAQADREAGDQQLDAKIKEVDERLQGNINYEASVRQAEDVLLGKRIADHEVKVNELHVEANRVHNSKLDKNFSNAEISTLPVSSSDYVVIVSNGNTYRVTLEQLAVLISQKTDYFKGQYSSLDHLNSQGTNGLQGGDYAYVDTEFTDSEGNTYYQFVTYVWDVEDGRWEETRSSQYATQADYTALVQSLLDGTFNLGSVKANSSPEESPLLKSLHVNQKDYSLPSVEIELSDEHVEGAYDMNSFKINGVIWNVPKNVKEIVFSTEKQENSPALKNIKIDGESWNINDDFLSFGIGRKFDKGFVFDQTYAEDATKVSDIYRFEAYTDDELMGYYTIQFNKNVKGKFYYRFDKHDGTQSGYSDSPTLTVGGSFDYWVLIEIMHETGVRLGTTLENRFTSIENKVNSLENSGGGSVITKNTYEVNPSNISIDLTSYIGGARFVINDDELINFMFNNRDNMMKVKIKTQTNMPDTGVTLDYEWCFTKTSTEVLIGTISGIQQIGSLQLMFGGTGNIPQTINGSIGLGEIGHYYYTQEDGQSFEFSRVNEFLGEHDGMTFSLVGFIVEAYSL